MNSPVPPRYCARSVQRAAAAAAPHPPSDCWLSTREPHPPCARGCPSCWLLARDPHPPEVGAGCGDPHPPPAAVTGSVGAAELVVSPAAPWSPACSEVWAGGGITSGNGVSTLVASESQAGPEGAQSKGRRGGPGCGMHCHVSMRPHARCSSIALQ
jgi:hypothetical protein